jgi:hypothetical protein
MAAISIRSLSSLVFGNLSRDEAAGVLAIGATASNSPVFGWLMDVLALCQITGSHPIGRVHFAEDGAISAAWQI